MKLMLSVMLVCSPWMLLAQEQHSAFGPRTASSSVPVEYPSPGQRAKSVVTVGDDGKVTFALVNRNLRETPTWTVAREDVSAFQTILEKSIEWADIAVKNEVERFERPIGKLGKQEIIFRYSYPEARIVLDPLGLDSVQAAAILRAIPLLDATETELNRKVAKAKSETELFR